jgi:hypothetical protein
MKAINAKSSTLENFIDRRNLNEGNNSFMGTLKDSLGAVLLIDFNRK